jgi:hypothetical protein
MESRENIFGNYEKRYYAHLTPVKKEGGERYVAKEVAAMSRCVSISQGFSYPAASVSVSVTICRERVARSDGSAQLLETFFVQRM